MSQVKLLSDQLAATRAYTQRLLEGVAADAWFAGPPQRITTLGWQLGHLAVAEYGLAVERVRGLQPGDEQLLPPEFRPLFGQGSQPRFDPAAYPPLAHIRQVFDRVHQAALAAAATLTEADLDTGVSRSHPLFTTKGGSLSWCARHESIHAGQIALLKRQLGGQPLW